jgi:hypothetical protein
LILELGSFAVLADVLLAFIPFILEQNDALRFAGLLPAFSLDGGVVTAVFKFPPVARLYLATPLAVRPPAFDFSPLPIVRDTFFFAISSKCYIWFYYNVTIGKLPNLPCIVNDDGVDGIRFVTQLDNEPNYAITFRGCYVKPVFRLVNHFFLGATLGLAF